MSVSGDGRDQCRGTLGGGGIGEDGIHLAGLADLLGGGIQLALRAAGDGDLHALGGEPFGDGEADAGGGSGDDGGLAGELKVHGVLLS
jgi:hypothetical protein